MDWKGLKKERIDLAYPLLIIKGSNGLLSCGYLNIDICDKNDEACAIVFGVKSHDDMLNAELKAVTRKAGKLGLRVGMKGQEALEILR